MEKHLDLTMPHPTSGKYIKAIELHEQGMIAMMQIVTRKTSDLCLIFVPNQMVQSLWLHTGGWRPRDQYTWWVIINLGTYAEAASDVFDFIQKIMKKVSEISSEKIHYQYGSNPWLLQLLLQANLVDERCKTISINTSIQDIRCVTLAVTVCVDGMKLPPMYFQW